MGSLGKGLMLVSTEFQDGAVVVGVEIGLTKYSKEQ